ncbi:MAG: hypothetical protein AB1529_05160, partial [Candidatus Micrarchaeota archaeon]
EDVSSSGDEVLEEGDYISIVQDPEVWKLSYKGLDLTSEDMSGLKFELKTTDKTISESKGPDIEGGSPGSGYPGDGDTDACIIFAPYVEVTSGSAGSTFSVDRTDAGGAGELSDDEFFIPLNDGATDGITGLPGGDPGAGSRAALCDDDDDGVVDSGDVVVFPGSVFMKISPSSSEYGFAENPYPNDPFGIEVGYDKIGDGDDAFAPPDGGALLIQGAYAVDFSALAGNDDSQLGDLFDSAGLCDAVFNTDCGEDVDDGAASAGVPDWYFAIAEKAGTGSSNEFVDYFVFALDGASTGTPGDATFDFDATDGAGETLASDSEEILYGHATPNAPVTGGGAASAEFYGSAGEVTGPVNSGLEVVEEGYVSERGSVFKVIDDDTVQFDMAHKLARAQWLLAPASTSAADASKTIVTLGEGESETVSGVTVKVLEITEDVGACSAAGGSVSCTADMSGVSAVIMPNNAGSVAVAVPSTYANLVVLDSDATGLSTIISVGGDKVNSVTADLLSSSPVDWAAEKKVVREVVQGSKIIVAGAEATDTLAAAQDFVAQVTKTQ